MEVSRESHWLSQLPPPAVSQLSLMTLSSSPLPISLQFSGNPTPSGWRIKGQCVETWPSSSASSPLQCRNMLALCPGRRTQSPSSQVRKNHGATAPEGAGVGGRESRGAELVVELTKIWRLVLASNLLLFGILWPKSVFHLGWVHLCVGWRKPMCQWPCWVWSGVPLLPDPWVFACPCPLE